MCHLPLADAVHEGAMLGTDHTEQEGHENLPRSVEITAAYQ